MSASGDLRRIRADIKRRHAVFFQRVVVLSYESIKLGSPITGSPGQPVGQYGPGYHPGTVGGTLRNSWQMELEAPGRALISSNLIYAAPIEYGIGKFGALRLRSTVGGFHSRAITIAGMQRIVDYAGWLGREVTYG
jgi:hypothetical protein